MDARSVLSLSPIAPPSPTKWLPGGHLAYFLLDVIGELSVAEIEAPLLGKDARGTRPYNPRMMLAIVVYGYCVGVFSSRKLERATYDSVPFRVIAAGNHPHFTTISEFRKDNLGALKGLFLQVLRLCQEAGLVKLGHVAFDGTKVQGNASKHKAMSHDRMRKSEARLREEIEALLARAADVDDEENAALGVEQRDEDIPAELHRRTERLSRIRAAKAALEAEAAEARAQELREQAERARKLAKTHPNPSERKRAATRAKKREQMADELVPAREDAASPPFTTQDGLPTNRVPHTADGQPKEKAQRNFTDPDSRIMEKGGEFLQGYNCQAGVDEAHQVIVAEAVTNQAPDNGNLVPMVKKVKQNCGAQAEKVTADAGYWSPEVPTPCEELGTDPYISTRRREAEANAKTDDPDPPPHLGPDDPAPDRDTISPCRDRAIGSPPPDATGSSPDPDQTDTMSPADDEPAPLAKMRTKLGTSDGAAIYRRRKATVEPVFGQIKEAMGFRRFSLRGMPKVQAEWSLVCLAHNLLKLFRYGNRVQVLVGA